MDKKIVMLSIGRLAHLANLKVSPQEKRSLGPKLKKTVAIFAVLDKVAGLNRLAPTFQVTKNKNIVHQDRVKKSLPLRAILRKGSFFRAEGGLRKR